MNKKAIITNKKSLASKYQKQRQKGLYSFDEYVNGERWISYYHQVKEVLSVAKMLNRSSIKVLEIGIGNGTVSGVLKAQGMKVTTMDMDSELCPDYIGALPEINMGQKRKFDCILCCEVLEHINYKDAEKSLTQMAERSAYSVISVPQRGISFSITTKLWFFKTLKLFVSVKNFKKFNPDGYHHWELDANGVTTKRFKNSIENAGFKILNDYRVPEFPYHHFFVVKSQVL